MEAVANDIARVRMDGELWEVNCEQPLAEDDTVVIDSIDGVILQVSKREGE